MEIFLSKGVEFVDLDKIKNDFPIFARKVNGKDLVFLDSAATSQKPREVIDSMKQFYEMSNANAHRGIYKLSEEATEAYENARKKIGQFIGSDKPIVYTAGATEAINLVMHGYGEQFVKKGDKIVVSIMEHHSNFVPWQQLAKKKQAKFEVMNVNEQGEIPENELEKINEASIVAITHASNVLGTINPVKEICKMAREEEAISMIDGAQSVPHIPVDVKKLGCDFLAFSGHKMLGPTGIGILYGREDLLEKMQPFLFGGEMISEVTIEKTEWNHLPYKFEAGTQPIAQAVGLGAAVDYLKKISMEKIAKYEQELTTYAFEKLSEIENLQIYGPSKQRIGTLAFNLKGIHAHDLATILDEQGIAIRSGHHCAMPLHTRLGIGASARASFYIYNTKQDVDKLVEALQYAKKVFRL